MKTRGSGILLHITSLPTNFGIGDLGPVAHEFIEFLQKAGQRYWQILPIHPTDKKYDNSPYHSLSAFAGNPLLISPEFLVKEGFLDESDLYPTPEFKNDFVDFSSVISYKNHLFDMAYNRFKFFGNDPAFSAFCSEQFWWLNDYALFMVIRNQNQDKIWSDWPLELKNRNDEYLKEFWHSHQTEIEKVQFIQYVFSLQWNIFLKKCHEYGIWLIGDIPIYVDYDSSDVWSNSIWFQLDENKKPNFVAGVPPDYFSETGQIWNNPLYAWDKLVNDNFSWWKMRIHHELQYVDFLRIDHFRGLAGFWEIPAGSNTAIHGRWVTAPAWNFLRTMEKNFSYLPIIAEDLGVITPDVREILNEFKIPGMNVLHFAFSSETSENPYILHNIKKESIVYTGTHDNNTTLGWFTKDSTEIEKQRLFSYLGREISSFEISEVFIRLAMMSNANTAIIPMQDILNLDDSARMNRPGIDEGNWKWKMHEKMFTDEHAHRLQALSKIYGRL